MINKLIPSQYVRMYMSKKNFQFQDIDIATIIYHAPLPVPQSHQLLTELAEKTKNFDLQKQIRQRLAYDKMCFARFACNDGSCFYEVTARENTDKWDSGDVIGHFATVDLAISHTKPLGVAFSLQKYQIIGLCRNIIVPQYSYNPRLFSKETDIEQAYMGDAISGCRYNATGQLLKCWSNEMTKEETAVMEDWGAKRFEWRFVQMPNPFDLGDVVKSTNTNRIGVVATSQADWNHLLNRVDEGNLVFDYTDASITVEFQQKDGTCAHEHIQPIYLEKA